MAVDANLASLFENLKVEDPWVRPKTWESIPFESGLHSHPDASSLSSSNQPLYDLSTVSEASLVRLAMNAMQGVKSALISIQKLSSIFCSDPADRTFHQISSLWKRASSTHSLGNVLKSIGCTGSLVFLLREFVDYFTNMNLEDSLISKSENHQNGEVREEKCPPHTLVNQAFAVAVGKVLEGYICALDTVYASAVLRCPSNDVALSLQLSSVSGCLKSIVHSKITLLEFYLHTKELRTQIEALGSICNLHKLAICLSDTSFDGLIAEATSEFSTFYRGADLLTFLYAQLNVADPAHCNLLKFLFLQSCEPYCGFIRSWIFKAEINDPYKEFIVKNIEHLPPNPVGKSGISFDFPLASFKEREGVAIPCFLKDSLVPLVRAGQQLQVLLKLLELCIPVATGDHSSEDFLPCWSGFSNSGPSNLSPLTFSRDDVEAMVLARDSYYKSMNEKLETLLTNLEIRYHQVPYFGNDGGTLDSLNLLISEDESIVLQTEDIRSSIMGNDNLDSDVSSTVDEFSYVEDMYDLSESSASDNSEEQLETKQLISGQQSYVSALSFSRCTAISSSMQTSCQHGKPYSDSYEIGDKKDANDHLVKISHERMISSCMSKSSCSFKINTQYRNSPNDAYWPVGHLLKISFDDNEIDGQMVTENHVELERDATSYLGNTIAISDALSRDALGKNVYDNNKLSLNLCSIQPQTIDHQYNSPSMNPLSKNPMLTRNALLGMMGRNGEKYFTDNRQSLPYFDFSIVDDPCKAYMDKLLIDSRYSRGYAIPLNCSESGTGNKNDNYCEEDHSGEDGLIDDTKVCVTASLDSKNHNQDVLADVSGGSSWERLLGSFRKTVNCDATHKKIFLSTFEIPLDIIIDKCLLQEIILQYNYVSKLTIYLLEEAFELKKHLLALRRYHFMEVADWADLFILSLWHHRWSVTEANERLSEIQGLLELSIQKSSCEQDLNKDRLFVYMKGHGKMPLPISTIGVRSFDFLGLGYRVDWPVNIVLTPAALKIYADIFSFLIQVKLAIFSLTDVWCSLKDLVHTPNKNLNSELNHHEVGRLNMIMKLRNQVSHFVSTLQQYVESQLSHVSWCGFLHSLQHKVKDMMDLESVHMEYLANSLRICFLSDETRTVGSIIESILQCALDFRLCLKAGAWDVEIDEENLSGISSRINISQMSPMKWGIMLSEPRWQAVSMAMRPALMGSVALMFGPVAGSAGWSGSSPAPDRMCVDLYDTLGPVCKVVCLLCKVQEKELITGRSAYLLCKV
ncbi:Gamma-tubulin complex component 6 [Senna tora]|uniref:Gamma-tubulin complex component 6 n=1 Tax=Senna tora TaxID=362788 RepID=A0A834T484_9FABA|nr:Gamma-tubulin complex component 6 [Senna tora]